MSNPNEYYFSLLAQGYPEQEAFVYTKQYYPGFQIPSVSQGTPSLGSRVDPEQVESLTAVQQSIQQPVSFQPQYNQPILLAPIKQSHPLKLPLIIGAVVVGGVAFIVIVTGVLYVMASDLAGSDEGEVLHGTWYNPADTMTFYPNGSVSETTDSISSWKVEDDDLILTFKFGNDTLEFKSVYDIRTDDDGNDILFIAFYEWDENGDQTDIVNKSNCVGYSDSIKGSNLTYFTDREAIFPLWCDPED